MDPSASGCNLPTFSTVTTHNGKTCVCEIKKNANYHKNISKSNSDSITNACQKNNVTKNLQCKSESLNCRHSDMSSNSISDICSEIIKNDLTSSCRISKNEDDDTSSCMHKAKYNINDVSCYLHNDISRNELSNCPHKKMIIKNNTNTKHSTKSGLLSCCHREVTKSSDCVTNCCCCQGRQFECCRCDDIVTRANISRGLTNYHKDDEIGSCLNDITLNEMTSAANKINRKIRNKTLKLEKLKDKQWSRDSNTAVNLVSENWKNQSPELRRFVLLAIVY